MADAILADLPDGVEESAWLAACAAVRAYCGWHVAPSVTETLTLDGSGSVFQMLPTLHVSDVASVTEDGTERVATEYEWSQSGQLWRAWPWSGHFRGVVVELTHGYEVCPDEILSALHEIATSELPASASSLTSGPYRVAFGASGPTAAAAFGPALDKYRIPPSA